MAYYDIVTNLPNRAFLIEKLEETIDYAKRKVEKFAVLFLDLDKFKGINDNYGHHSGDLLLKLVSERIKKNIRKVDFLARQGGDEFVIILPEIIDNQNIDFVVRKLIKIFEQPYSIFGNNLKITTSIGIAVYPSDGKNYIDLLKYADLAMYHAKNTGKNRYVYYQDISGKSC